MVQPDEFLFGAALMVLLGAVLAAAASAFAGGPSSPTKRCDRHDWSLHPETEVLQCTVCGFTAGG